MEGLEVLFSKTYNSKTPLELQSEEDGKLLNLTIDNNSLEVNLHHFKGTYCIEFVFLLILKLTRSLEIVI